MRVRVVLNRGIRRRSFVALSDSLSFAPTLNAHDTDVSLIDSREVGDCVAASLRVGEAASGHKVLLVARSRY